MAFTFVYGAPGVGKTHVSKLLSQKNNSEYVEGDYLREVVAQKEKTEAEDPFVYVGTKEAFRKFGPLTEENVIKGLHAVRESMLPYVQSEISKHSGSLVLEAAFLDPKFTTENGESILVITTNEELHRARFFAHREDTELNREGFQAARTIQDYLLGEAKGLPVKILENAE